MLAVTASLMLMAPPVTPVRAAAFETEPALQVAAEASPAGRDTLFLIGDARIDPALLAGSGADFAEVRAAWRRALGFAEWTDGAVLVADGASNYIELGRNDPALVDSVRSAVTTGAWAPVGGWWSRVEPGALHGESLIRQGLYGQRAFEAVLGRRPEVAWLEDGIRLPSTLPQILVSSGLTSMVLVGSGGAPGESGAGHRDEELTGAFAWEGNDGTRLPVARPFDYGDFADFEFEFPGPKAAGMPGAAHSLALYGVRDPGWESGRDTEAPVSPNDSFDPAGGSRGSGRAPRDLPVVRFAAPARALAAIRDGGEPALPTRTGEIDPVVTLPPEGHAATAASQGPREGGATVSRVERSLQIAEATAAVASGLPDAEAYPGALLESAWRGVLEAEALLPHQDGTGTLGEDLRAALSSAASTADSIATSSFAAIRSEMETDEYPAGAYILFNPLAHARRGVAFVELGRGGGARGGSPESEARDLVLVNVPEIPALGALAIPIGADGLPGVLPLEIQPPTAGDLWLENAFLRVEIDPSTGAISSILDKSNRRQALNPGGRANVLLVSPDPAAGVAAREIDRDSISGAGPLQDPPGEITRLLSLSSSVTARAATVTITRGWNRSTIRQQLVLARAARFLEIQSEIHWQDPGWRLDVRIDPVVEADSAHFAAPYGGETRAVDGSTDRPALHWASVNDESYGVSILGDRRDGWTYDGASVSLRLPAYSAATSRFAVYPHAGEWRTAGTASLAAGYVVPLLAALEPPHGGRLGRSFSLLSTDNPTAEIEWVKRAEDDDALVLRLVERSGRSTETRVSTACPRISAWRASHLEEPISELPSSRAGFRIRLRGYEIATVLVACEG
jgi:alpha-mannosidase